MKISASEKINHTLERILILIGFIIAVYFMRELKGILVPLVFAIFLAFLLNPFVSFLTDRKIPGWLIMLIVLIVVSVVLFLLGIIVYAGVSSFVEDFPYYLDKLLEIITEMIEQLKIPIADLELFFTEKINWLDIADRLSLQQLLTSTMGSFLDFAVKLVFTILLLMFIIAERKSMYERVQAMSVHAKSKLNPNIIPEIQKKIQTYISRKFLISLGTGITAMLICKLFGLQFIIMIGLITFLLNFIPSIGSIIATIFPIIICLLQYGFVPRLPAVIILLVSTQFFFGNVLEPRFMGRGLKLSPLFILVSLFLWNWIWGPIGMIVCVPIQAIIALILHYTKGSPLLRTIMGETISDSL